MGQVRRQDFCTAVLYSIRDGGAVVAPRIPMKGVRFGFRLHCYDSSSLLVILLIKESSDKPARAMDLYEGRAVRACDFNIHINVPLCY